MEFLDTPGKRRQRRIKRFLYGSVAIIFLGSIARSLISPKTEKIISPVADEPTSQTENVLSAETQITPTAKPAKRNGDLTAIIKETVGTTWANYSVIVTDYNSNFRVAVADSVIYVAASVNKIPILAALYSEAKKGNVDLDDTITLQARDIQDYGTGSIRYAKPGTVYSIKTLARLMINQSDNTAAFIIANHVVGLKNIQTLVDSWGLAQTDMTENTTSNADIEKLMKMIFERKIAGEAYTREMLSFMTETEFEDRLPSLLPEEATVYHKIGTEVRIMHDAGVIEYGNTKYYVGIFVGDALNYDTDTALMAKLSRTIFDYMTGN